jgi:hypothetical protein
MSASITLVLIGLALVLSWLLPAARQIRYEIWLYQTQTILLALAALNNTLLSQQIVLVVPVAIQLVLAASAPYLLLRVMQVSTQRNTVITASVLGMPLLTSKIASWRVPDNGKARVGIRLLAGAGFTGGVMVFCLRLTTLTTQLTPAQAAHFGMIASFIGAGVVTLMTKHRLPSIALAVLLIDHAVLLTVEWATSLASSNGLLFVLVPYEITLGFLLLRVLPDLYSSTSPALVDDSALKG